MNDAEKDRLFECPFCGSEIKKKAKKCNECGSFIEWVNDNPIAINLDAIYEELHSYLLTRILKRRLKEIGESASRLEVKWRGGFISTKKIKDQLLRLDAEYTQIKSKLENLDEKQKPFFIDALEKYKQNLDKLKKIESLKDKLKISRATDKHLKKELKSEQRLYEKRLVAFMKHYKQLMKKIKSNLNSALKRKEILQVEKALNEIDETQYDEEMRTLTEKIDVCKEMLNFLKEFKKELQLLRIYY